MSSTEAATSGEFTCDMDGYTRMVAEITNLALLAVTLLRSTVEGMMDLMGLIYAARAWTLGISFLQSSNQWVGYAIAAAYFFGLEFGYGDYLCQASGYGYYVIYYLNIVVTFGQSV